MHAEFNISSISLAIIIIDAKYVYEITAITAMWSSKGQFIFQPLYLHVHIIVQSHREMGLGRLYRFLGCHGISRTCDVIKSHLGLWNIWPVAQETAIVNAANYSAL